MIGLAATRTVAPLGYVGVIPLVKGVIGMCSICSVLEINSCFVGKK